MKLIFENWKAFIKEQESGIPNQNIQFLLDALKRFGPWDDDGTFENLLVNPEVITGIVEQVPQLKQNKIKRILGSGTMGVVFELDNGRALKLYRRGYVDDQEGFYDNEAGKIFSGQGRIMTLPIFDRGKTSPEIGLNYVEMAKVLPFNKFLERTGRLDKGLRYRPVDWDDEFFLKNILKLTDAEIKSLSNMINYALENYGLDYLGDLHTGNFGVLEQTMSSKNPVFVLFDP